MPKPVLLIDRKKILSNARQVVGWAHKKDVQIFGVTKSLGGSVELASLFLESGFYGLADSRLQNLQSLKQHWQQHPNQPVNKNQNPQQSQNPHYPEKQVPLMYLRIPAMAEAMQIVKTASLCVVTETAAVQVLSKAAVAAGKNLEIIIMVEMGDRREGVLPQNLPVLCETILAAPGLHLIGLGANYACVSGSLPSPQLLVEFVNIAQNIEKKYSIRFSHLSGGNSAVLSLLQGTDAEWPVRINFVRLAHDVLLGIDGTNYRQIPELEQGVFKIQTELIECKRKPSLPGGECGLDAWGQKARIVDRGNHLRGLVNVGRVDIVPESLVPKDERLSIIGASSDVLVLDMEKAPDYRVGDTIEFFPRYASVVQAWHSPYVEKVFF